MSEEERIIKHIGEFFTSHFKEIIEQNRQILNHLKKISMTQDELVTALTDLKTEVDGVSTKVDALEAAITSAGTSVPQTVQDAFANLKSSVDTLNSKAVVPGA